MKLGEKSAACRVSSGCEVFAGVRLTCLRGQEYATPFEGKNRLEILYCHTGSLECRAGGRRQALGAGDVLICTGSAAVVCPRGVSVALELGAAQESMRHILRDLEIDLYALREAYCTGGQATLLRANQSLTHVFAACRRAFAAPMPRPGSRSCCFCSKLSAWRGRRQCVRAAFRPTPWRRPGP